MSPNWTHFHFTLIHFSSLLLSLDFNSNNSIMIIIGCWPCCFIIILCRLLSREREADTSTRHHHHQHHLFNRHKCWGTKSMRNKKNGLKLDSYKKWNYIPCFATQFLRIFLPRFLFLPTHFLLLCPLINRLDCCTFSSSHFVNLSSFAENPWQFISLFPFPQLWFHSPTTKLTRQ